MLGKGGSKLRFGCENPQKQHYRTSWIQPLRTEFRNIPQIDWSCPPRFLVDTNWKLEAGSESQETHIQLQRESRIAEAVYYHNSDIPPNPYVALNALDFNDDSRIPVIPLDIINDETSPNDPLLPYSPTVKAGEKTSQPLLPRDEVIATAVALVAFIKSKEPGSQIDIDLLVQLLCNPGMLEKLTEDHGLSTNQSSVITRPQPHEHSLVPFPAPMPAVHNNSESQNLSSNKKVDVGKLRKLINEYGLGDDSVKPGPAVVKDVDYYRRLVSLHGMVQEYDNPRGSVKPTEFREQRPCVYFNSPKGCRHGSHCQFQHVKGIFREEQHGAKRMKLHGGCLTRR